MRKVPRVDAKVLTLARMFEKCRAERRRYPSKLKNNALEMVRSGIKPSALAKALGVSQSSFSYWKKSVAVESVDRPVELRVEDEVRAQADNLNSADLAPRKLCAEVRLRSGVVIDVPMAALTFDFLAQLSQLELGYV